MIRRHRKLVVAVLMCSLVATIAPGVVRHFQRSPIAASAFAGPAVGTVGDLTWGVSRAEIDRTVTAMSDAGVTWVRANQNWAAGEPDSKGVFNDGWLAEVDYAVDKARAAGFQVLMPIADGVPYWASADPAKYIDAGGGKHWNKLWRPTNPSDYAAFVSATVNRYKLRGVHTYEVWNEPNHPFFWPSGVSAIEYTALLSAGYPAIKAADPTATVLLGGLAKSDWSYLTDLYSVGAKPYFDAVALHPYTGSVDPTWCWVQEGTTKPAKDAFCGIEEARATMVANGDSAKKIWLTEFGWSTTTAAYGVSEANQADFLNKALTKVATSYPYVAAAFWYNFRNTAYYQNDPGELEANWGLVRTDFTAKPALAALKTFAASVLPVTVSVNDLLVVEGGPAVVSDATFSVSLSLPAAQTVTVKAATANITATAGSDYTAVASTTVSFAPGETTKTVRVPVIGDSVAEGNETFVVNLSAPVGAALADAQGLATILDEEGSPTLSVNDVTVAEGGPATTASATFSVSLSAPAAQTVTVSAATAAIRGSTATAGSDYTAVASTTVSFALGETTKAVTVPVIGDSVAEGNETFVVNLSAPVGAALADAQGLATILDEEGPPTLSVSNVTVLEGGPAVATDATFSVSLSTPAAQTVTVKAATANITATAGSDYTAVASTTVSFAPGERTKTVRVPVTGDSVAEGNETFVVNLSAPVGAVLADAQGLATILDEEGSPTLSVNDVWVAEGGPATTASATFNVSLSAPAAQTVTVKAATAAIRGSTATAGSDYTAVAPTTVSFAPGERTKTVTVPVIGDSVAEANETFVVNLSVPVGAALADAQGLATIANDDGLLGILALPPGPSLSITDATVVEGGPGTTTQATFTISLSAPAPLLVTVNVATANVTATAGSDYVAPLLFTTVGFLLGERTKTVTVPVIGDSVAEGNETFVVNLSAPVGVTLADAQGLATILDEEGSPTLSVSNVTVLEGGPAVATDATFSVSLSTPAAQTVTVKAATANITATEGSDYTAVALTTVSFAPGERTKTVRVPVTGDSVAEGNETFVVNLSAPVGAVLADAQGLATILDEEGSPTLSVSDVTVAEGGPATTASATFNVSLSAPAAQTVTVKAATANITATAGSDYTAVASTTVSFAPGETTKTVRASVIGDSVAEANETFAVNLSAPLGAVLADAQGLATIANDE